MDPTKAQRLIDALLHPQAEPAASVEAKPAGKPEIAGYSIDRLLGEGSSGRVWLARREGSDRPVAIKILRQRLGDGPSSQRAWRELSLLDGVRLPSVPRLLDYGMHNGGMYLVTEFVEGERIDTHAERSGLNTRQRVELLIRLATALGELHARGVIHRDLKPGNVLVTDAGDPVIIDLGIAALRTDEAWETLTAEGTPIGTPAYMAPEQARGDRDAVGTRSDVYALGAIAYVLLTGTTPHALEDLTLFESIRCVGHEPPRRPREIDRAVSKALDAVLARACDVQPGARYASAVEFADDLGRWLRREPVLANGRTAWQSVTRWIGRHPVWATSAVAASVLASSVALSVGFTWYTLRRPATVEIVEDGAAVVLRSDTGHPVQRWEYPGDGVVRYASRLRRADSNRFFVALAGRGHDGHPLDHAIGLFPGLDVENPLWSLSHRNEWRELPKDIDALQSERFRPLLKRTDGTIPMSPKFVVADIFIETPGDEIAVAYSHSDLSPSCIRVLSGVDGSTLYEVWHDGAVDDIEWLPRAGVIACLGCSNSLWKGEDAARVWNKSSPYPRSVFALRPVYGAINRRSIASPDIGGAAATAWFKAFVNPQWNNWFQSMELQVNPLQASSVAWTIKIYGATPGVSGRFSLGCDLDAGGRVVGLNVADTWEARYPDLPPPAGPEDIGLVDVTGYDPASGRLGDWPPVSRAGESSSETRP